MIMRTNDPHSPGGSHFPNDERPWINVLVLYDNEASRVQAACATQNLGRELGAELDVRTAWSRLELLSEPEILRSATRALRESEIVLFSVTHGLDLPVEARAWVESELVGRDCHEGGLLALIEVGESRASQPSSARLFLGEVAHAAGLDFLSQTNGLIFSKPMNVGRHGGVNGKEFSGFRTWRVPRACGTVRRPAPRGRIHIPSTKEKP